MNTNIFKKTLLAVAMGGAVSLTHAQDNNANNLFDAFANGEGGLSFRYRLELVDQDGFSKDATASTVRTRVDYTTREYKGWTFYIESETVTEVLADNYNAGAGNSPGNTQYPVVADPQGSEINQAWVRYTFAGDNSLKLGRQRISLDNERFVGGVIWRQNEQTYDAVSGSFKLGGSDLFVAWVENVNRIFGDDVPAGDNDSETLLVNWSNDFVKGGKLVAYYYGIDNQDVPSFSTNTYGVKFAGKQNAFGYGLEYANQSDAANNPVDYSADYYRLDVSYAFDPATLFAGYEVLTGDANKPGAAFRTPLATLHAFNGWADKFLTTPDAGLVDTFAGFKGQTRGFKWQALYHDFQAEDGGVDYGTEFDAIISKKVNKYLTASVKAALYSADQYATDTTKFWFMLLAKF